MSLAPELIIGAPLQFHDIFIYPPKIKDLISNKKYSLYCQLLTTSQEDIWDMMVEKEQKGQFLETPPENAPTPFEYLLVNCYYSEEVMKLTQEAFSFFTHETVKIIPKTKIIIFTNNLEKVEEARNIRNIQEEDFFDFQNKIREALGDKILEQPKIDEDPRVARIKAKTRYRERIKKKVGNKNSISLSTMLVALCCMEIGISPLNIGEIPYPVASAIFSMYQDKEKYRIDTSFLAGGANPKKLKPKYWIRNLE